MKKIVSLILVLTCVMALASCSNKSTHLTDLDYNSIDKIQVISSMGNPTYGADSKIITDGNEIKEFIKTFNSGVIGKKVNDDEIGVGFTSEYIFYNNEEKVNQVRFNANNTNVVALDSGCFFVEYGDMTSPYKLYKNSKSSEIVVDIDGKEMDLIRYNEETYVKSKLTAENIEWLEMYNSLTDDEKDVISFVPDLGEPFNAN